MDLPALWATGESIVAQNGHAHTDSVLDYDHRSWPMASVVAITARQ